MKHIIVQRGYTLLFAVLTAALVLGVAVFIAGVTRKQFQLSSSARDSMYSFYAADSGIECAVEAQPAAASTSSSATNYITCNGSKVGQNFSIIPIANSPPGVIPSGVTVQRDAFGDGLYEESFDIGLPGTTCADIYIFKYTDTTGDLHTVIQSHGYNTCFSQSSATFGDVPFTPDTTNPETVERALQLTYE